MLPKKETLTIEFKSDKKKYPDSEIFDAVVAFANTEGGDLYLGIEDSGEVTGVHSMHENPITLSAYIANNTIPPVSIRAEIIYDKLPVLKISVPKSLNGIVSTINGKVSHRRIKADGTPENIPMYPYEFATRMSDLRMLDYSAMPIKQSSTDDFDPIEIERLKNIIFNYNGDKSLLELQEEDIFKALGLVREQDNKLIPTVTGLLLIGKVSAIKQHIPTHSTSFQVLVGTDVKVNKDISSPLLSTISEISNYLDAWNPERELELGLFRVPIPDFDKRAIREAIVNAFSHRDYSKMGRVRIAITDEGITIANPGGFVEGVSIKNLLTAEPHGRNPQLADALKRIGLAERTGRGIDRIYEGSLIYGNTLPDYRNSTSVTVSLFIPKSRPDIQLTKLIFDEQKKLGHNLSLNSLIILNTLRDFPKSTIKEVEVETNISEVAIVNILDEFVDRGIIEESGRGKSKGYILSPKVYKVRAKKAKGNSSNEEFEDMIVDLARRKDGISRSDVVDLLGVGGDKAYNLLKKLVKDERLRVEKNGRYTRYFYLG